MAKGANSTQLRDAFTAHLDKTRGQVERLGRVFESVEQKPSGKHCEGMTGLIQEAKGLMEEEFDETALDAARR